MVVDLLDNRHLQIIVVEGGGATLYLRNHLKQMCIIRQGYCPFARQCFCCRNGDDGARVVTTNVATEVGSGYHAKGNVVRWTGQSGSECCDFDNATIRPSSHGHGCGRRPIQQADSAPSNTTGCTATSSTSATDTSSRSIVLTACNLEPKASCRASRKP